MRKLLSDKTVSIASLILLTGIWHIAAAVINNPHLIPTPFKTVEQIYIILKSPDFLSITGVSLIRGLTALIISLAAGFLFGFLSGIRPLFRKLLQPAVTVIRSTPVISVILLALIWLDPTQVPVFTGLLIMFPVIYSSVSLGVSQTDPQLIELAQVYQLKKSSVFFNIYLPSLKPYLFQSISTAFGIGWKAIIASEVLSQPSISIGTEMQNAQTVLNVPGVAGWTVIALIISYIFDSLIQNIEKRSRRWSNSDKPE